MWPCYCVCRTIVSLYSQRGPLQWAPPWARPPQGSDHFPVVSHPGRRAAHWRSCRWRPKAAKWGPPGGNISLCSTCSGVLVSRRLWSPVRRTRSGPERLAASQRYGNDTWTLGKRRRCVEGEAHLCWHAHIKHDWWPEQRSITNLLSNLCFFSRGWTMIKVKGGQGRDKMNWGGVRRCCPKLFDTCSSC